jgi:hypothetical protein
MVQLYLGAPGLVQWFIMEAPEGHMLLLSGALSLWEALLCCLLDMMSRVRLCQRMQSLLCADVGIPTATFLLSCTVPFQCVCCPCVYLSVLVFIPSGVAGVHI